MTTILVSKALTEQPQLPLILMTGEASFAIETWEVFEGLLVGKRSGRPVVVLPAKSDFLLLHRDLLEMKDEDEVLREKVRRQQRMQRIVASEQPIQGGEGRA